MPNPKLRVTRRGNLMVGGALFLVSPQAERLRPYLAKRGHRRTFKAKSSVYLRGAVKNALLSKIEKAERGDDRAYIMPQEFLVEQLGLKPADAKRRQRRKTWR